MSLTPLHFSGKIVGAEFSTDFCRGFFSNAHLHPDQLAEIFPGQAIKSVNQVHGDSVIHVHKDSSPTTADGQYTTENNLALVIKTADCLPVLLAHPQMVCAVHAGWRGIENEIIISAIDVFLQNNLNPDQVKVWIGPHIHHQSFEVSKDVGQRLDETLARAQKNLNECLPSSPIKHPDPEKVFVDLTQIALTQLWSKGVQRQNICLASENTFESSDFHSYRRDGNLKGRQYSIIYKTGL